ncbi:MAG: lysophospholipid acyltransferase family protein [Pigmentiphaga sp.]
MAWIRSLLYAIFMVVTVIPYALACLLWRPLPLRLRYKLTVGWPTMCVWAAKYILGIRWRLIGEENLPEGPAIVLSKHQSAWETMFFAGWMPKDICYVYKRELNWIPFFGWSLAALEMVPINRQRGSESFEQIIRHGRRILDDGRWLLMFPEGTRTAPGKIGKYKSGGARVAVRLGTQVIPIAHNAGELWPRNAFIKRPGLVTVSIGPVIQTEGLTADQVNQQVETWIETEMRRLNPERYPESQPH